MDIAFCTENQRVYTAVEFAALERDDLERMRRQLNCCECNGPAFFRKNTADGRAACFGARPHEAGCTLAAQDGEQLGDGAGINEDQINNPGERIVLDLDFGAVEREVHANPVPDAGRPGLVPRFVAGNARPNARMHRRLRTLLRTLVEVPAFRNSEQLIEVDPGHEMAVREFFVPLLQITAEMRNRYRGWWGLIVDARYQSQALWLNSGGRDSVSVCIPEAQYPAVLQRFGITDIEQLAGAYILVVSSLSVSQNRKKYIPLDSPNHLTLRLA